MGLASSWRLGTAVYWYHPAIVRSELPAYIGRQCKLERRSPRRGAGVEYKTRKLFVVCVGWASAHTGPKLIETGKQSMSELGQFSEANPSLFENYLKGSLAQEPSGLAPITRRTSTDPAPLSLAQEQIWLHAQVTPDCPVYNETVTVHRHGPLNVAVLERCLAEIIRRHEVLRTTFATVDGHPVQVVHSAPEKFSLPVVDLRSLPQVEREPEALRIFTLEARKLFDLERGPLFRAMLATLDDNEHQLFLTFHHIIFDGVSVHRVFLPELQALYEAFSSGKPSPLAELPFQHADFACWQRQWVQGESFAERMAYWRRQLAGELSPLELPTDRPRPPVRAFRGGMMPFTLPESLSEALQTLSRREGVSLFMTLLASFAVLLHRYSGQEDILIGSATAGRNQPDLEKQIGPFLNTIVLRTSMWGEPTFRELLGRVRAVTLAALQNDDVPFDRVMKELQPKPDRSRPPIFQATLALEPRMSRERSGWDVTGLDVNAGAAKYDLSVVADDRPEGIAGRLVYNSDLFDAATISRMVEHWKTLLDGVVADPARPVARLPLLTDAERHKMLVEWNDTARDLPLDRCIHELIEAQAERTPNSVAVIFEGQTITYRELNTRANQLAHHLRTIGVGPEVLVGICTNRSLEMVVALLAILKAGGAYVPLDPDYPEDRLAFVLSDSGLQVLVTEKEFLAKFPQFRGTIVCLDVDQRAIARQSAGNPRSGVRPENLCYVLFTSGSTGKPKGVLVQHRSLVNFLCAMRERPGITSADTVIALTTISFDIASLELYLPLTVGGRVALVKREVAGEGQVLQEKIAKYRATLLQATPATWRLLLNSGWRGKKDLKILCGGEALTRELAEELLKRSACLWNMYGPTETAVWSTVQPIIRDNGPITIGRPIANTQIYVLDAHRQPVPVGVTGELCIGGAGVARGYLNRPELTAEKFIPDPFRPEETEARLYRTGDLARFRTDGTLECLGRVDHQVKVRGYRIEPGEIESVLSQHPEIREVTVVAREDQAGDARLVAYLVRRNGKPLVASDLRSFVRKDLPEYMVPSAFVQLDKLPMTPNGKVDRKALPAPQQSERPADEERVAPRNEVEARLAKIWKSVLGQENISVRDDFFELGGHSLLVAMLLVRIEQQFGSKLTMAAVFEAPTIEKQAALVQDAERHSRVSEIVPIRTVGSLPPFFCVNGGPKLLELAQKLDANRPFLGVSLEPQLADKLTSPYRLEEVSMHLAQAIRGHQPHGPYFVGGFCFNGVLAYEIARQLSAQGEKVALVALIEADNPAHTRSFSKRTQAVELAGRLRWKRIKSHVARLTELTGRDWKEYWTTRWADLRADWLDFVFQARLDLEYRLTGRLRTLKQMLYLAGEAHHPRPYSGRVAYFLCADRAAKPQGKPDGGWAPYVRGHFEAHEIPGDHLGILAAPGVDILAEKLRACLFAAQEAECNQSEMVPASSQR